MTTYPFRQGIDYGPRQGTLGLAFHMSEGGDGLVAYLARRADETVTQWRTRIRGVSANACILSDGTVWNMVDWSHAAGSMNPADRNPATTGYYNGTVIKDVLGSHYVDPNTWSIAAEIAGYRANGPTAKQVDAAIAWALDMKSRFPTLRGAFGHHDQTDTKGCPGTTANMKAIFAGIGGHGLWEVDVTPATIDDETPKTVTTALNSPWYDLDGKTVLKSDTAALVPRLSPYGAGTKRAIYATTGGIRRIVLVTPATATDIPPAVVDCDDVVKVEHDRVKAAAIAALEVL
jgi:hypothetical protein